MGGAAHNCRRAAYAAAPAGAAGTDRPLLREAARGRLRPRSPVEPPAPSSATVSVAATRRRQQQRRLSRRRERGASIALHEAELQVER